MRAMTLFPLLFAVGSAPANATLIEVVPSTSTAMIGDTITVDINVSGIADLYAFQFDLLFSPGVLTVTSVTGGLFLNSGGFFPGFTDNPLGEITFIADSLAGPVPGVTGDGPLAHIQFSAIGGGVSSITIANPILLDSALSDIPAVPNGGTVTVQSEIPEPGTMSLVLVGCAALAACRLIRNRKLRRQRRGRAQV